MTRDVRTGPRPFPFDVLFADHLNRPADDMSGRLRAVREAGTVWLNDSVLDTMPGGPLAEHLTRFYTSVTPHPWHPDVVGRHVGLIRYALIHLLRGHDPLPDRMEKCLTPGGAYVVPGLGRAFWAAAAKALAPDELPDWSADVEAGARRASLLPAAGRPQPVVRPFGLLAALYRRLLAGRPGVTAAALDDFFRRVARMTGREIAANDRPEPGVAERVAHAVRTVRSTTPLRKRLAESGRRSAAARAGYDPATADRDAPRLLAAVRQLVGQPAGEPSRAGDGEAENLWSLVALAPAVAESRDFAALFAHPAAARWGLTLPTALLHLARPNQFPVWDDALAAGLTALDDAFTVELAPADRYRLFVDLVNTLRSRFRTHPAEVADLIRQFDPAGQPDPATAARQTFHGFCGDTFRFLADLTAHNDRGWMTAHRGRYQFAVREPLVELCDALARRYVRPVLGGEYGWDVEDEAKPGRALTSICKNDYGRSAPYQPVVWLTFHRRTGGRREEAQLYVRLAADGLGYGFHLGKSARLAGRRFRKNIQEHGERLFAALTASEATKAFTFANGESLAPAVGVRTAADLRTWAAGKSLFAGRHLPPADPLLRSDDLVGEILIGFDRLVPLFAAACEDDPTPVLRRRAGMADAGPPFDRAAFRADTYLSDVWLDRTLGLLQLKRQLILQGVPGTGKTHVARSLARLLAHDRADAVRLVQFHPAYSYEEFVEGIRPRAVEVSGRTEVSYPVEDGLLLAFAARAARRPSEPHVLVIDEINRGNLPRVFGELLYLLEYRDQELTLPTSRRPFRLPDNLYLIGTMNAADHSTAALDQALRRRFSFVDMPPDPAVLASWLETHPPTDGGETFGPRVVRLFEELNRRLAADLGPGRQVGHSFFMVPGLTPTALRSIWDHHILPQLAEHAAGRPDRLRGYDLDALMGGRPNSAARQKPARSGQSP